MWKNGKDENQTPDWKELSRMADAPFKKFAGKEAKKQGDNWRRYE